MALALTFLEQYHKDCEEFLNHIVQVTADEAWVSYVNVETKEQSKQWIHTNSPNKPKKFKQKLPATKLMATVFWGRKGVLLVKFMQEETTITSEMYCKTLNKKQCRAIQDKRCGMLTSSVVAFHNNVCPHTAAHTRALLQHFNCELFDHPLYSPDLAPSKYHLFT
jgi:histone-lysine N-methyltransferase SETMAR